MEIRACRREEQNQVGEESGARRRQRRLRCLRSGSFHWRRGCTADREERQETSEVDYFYGSLPVELCLCVFVNPAIGLREAAASLVINPVSMEAAGRIIVLLSNKAKHFPEGFTTARKLLLPSNRE
ncbi:hypothetical protein NDU88_001627 [Pleurodeles waltl]|uniref:Uncharacterized protein n=1 Tax=Pleurodeles waltl TaxID=8319 RepID=A0AAV7V8B7_PLEWA|nr:hypothetical protein NDU88_001627 [Pleurodeles waltl]